MRPLVAPAFFVTLTAALLAAPPQPAQRAPDRSPETALDRYVAAPDPHFAWKVLRELPAEGATATLLEMTSQKWLTEKEVAEPLWKHWCDGRATRTGEERHQLLFVTRRPARSGTAGAPVAVDGRLRDHSCGQKQEGGRKCLMLFKFAAVRALLPIPLGTLA